jgi:hypothetical protein
MSAQEQTAYNHFVQNVHIQDTKINSLPDDAVLQLPDGTTVSGREYKDAWAKTDFEIYDIGHSYANGTTRGESDYNNGNPVVSLNIDILTAYDASPGGLDYLILHETAHLTPGQRMLASYDLSNASDGGTAYTEAERHAFEQMANDIAAAVANYTGSTVLTTAGDGYSPSHPAFHTPAPSP